ncbi:hypothetical protein GCM10010295_63490 [Streptomyces intermedius]
MLGEPEQGVGPQQGVLGGGAYLGLGGGAHDSERLEGEAAHHGVLAPGRLQQLGHGAADRAGGEPGAVLGAGRLRAQPRSISSAGCSMLPAGLWAATQICSSRTHTDQLPSGVSVAWPSA